MKKYILLFPLLLTLPFTCVKADVLSDFKIYDINSKYDSLHFSEERDKNDSEMSQPEKRTLKKMNDNYKASYNSFVNINHNTGFIDWNSSEFSIDNIYMYSFYTYHYNKLLKNYAVVNIILKDTDQKLFEDNVKLIKEEVKSMDSWDENKLTPQEIFLKGIALTKMKIINLIQADKSNQEIKDLIDKDYVINKDNFGNYIYSQSKGYEKQYKNLNKIYQEGSQRKYQYLIDLNRMNFD